MNFSARCALLAPLLALTACATTGTSGTPAYHWMGADSEKSYDKDLDARRLAETNNNDDYYEIHKDGRIYVLADADGYKLFQSIGEIPLVVTQIGAGPKGETVKLALTKKEAKVMEIKVGYKGGAQNMYERNLAGLDKGFFALVQDEDRFYVFDNWNELDAYRKTGTMPTAATTTQDGGKNVTYARSSNELAARFKTLNP